MNQVLRTNLKRSLLLLGGAASLVGCQEKPKETQKPNIVFILVDDLGWKDLGFMGSKYYETPNIDKLAGEGMVFTSAYSNAPNCAPSRACLMSGQFTPRHGIFTVAPSARGKSENRKLIPTKTKKDLTPDFQTLGESMKMGGYSTAFMGKWHLGDYETGPLKQGFDVNVAGCHWGHPKTYFSPYKNPYLKDGEKGENLTDRLTSEALSFISKNKENPFFLYLSFYTVHTPIQPKKEWKELYKGKAGDGGQNNPSYAGMVSGMDHNVGRLLAHLEKEGLKKNTLVVFFSDNGGVKGITDMTPLRGGKGMMYEGGIREPMIVSWPGKIKAGTRSDVPVIGTDFYPTFLDMAGIPQKSWPKLDGQSLKPLLLNQENKGERALFWHFPAYLEATHKNIGNIWRTTPAGAIRKGDWKLIQFFEDNKVELYNLKNDLSETTDLSEKHPEKVQELLKELQQWQKEVNAPIPTELNPEYQQQK